ncbi:xanthine dehydrogenase family protein molybdopterin-binding subunit [Bradyrhizobium sp. dw_411]|uniref:xanthine dehydrogenase family protein molybdopterin-binding subunit n=1 Tax=Bradyrhizobium sp. dw_411 TaxID=2720082 RepID=UPI001BCE57B9|nr:xanthine dehydrogenase family protein molybdopterin-binding subunit [Bradyrhizobium sp. dw_411]
MREYGIGQSVPRSEDIRLTQGMGSYTDDFAFPNQSHLFVVRSPHGSAKIRSINITAALELPGVRAVLTGKDVIADGLGPFPCRVKRHKVDGSPAFEPPYYALAIDRVRHVGDAVVALIADTLAIAKDASELVEIAYDPLPSVTETSLASQPGSPAVWDECPDNVCFVFEVGDSAAVEEAFSRAAHVARTEFTIARVSTNALEPRNAIGLYDRAADRFTLYSGTQAPHAVRSELAELVLKVPQNRVRVISPDVGGSFGMKDGIFPETALVLWAAKRCGTPVRWQSERTEAFAADHHSRDNETTAELALDAEGHFLALRVITTANMGAYLNANGPHPSTNNLGGLAGTYTTPAIYSAVTGVFSNTSPICSYRGAGRPEASFAIERVIDVAAREMGVDRAEIRRRNLIPSSAMPYKTALVFTYDSGEFESNLDRVLEISDWRGFERRRAQSRTVGKLRGIGLASVIEIAGGPLAAPAEEFAEIRFDPGGSVTLLSGTHSHGQGHETTFTQVIVETLGVNPSDVKVVYGDTDLVFHGKGTFGSRSASVMATAILQVANKLIKKGKDIASHLMEVSPDDVEFSAGEFSVVGTDRKLSISDVAKASYRLMALPPGIEPGFGAMVVSRPSAPTFPNGCHVCEVEIDEQTGEVSVVGYWVVDDIGKVLNPLLADGQLHGGIAQGLGEILLEKIVYDDEGQLVTASFTDYAMPRASDMPPMRIETNEVLTKANPFGVKGAGEAGCVGALPAIMNAIYDALAPLGVKRIDMPVTSERVWRALDEVRRNHGRNI